MCFEHFNHLYKFDRTENWQQRKDNVWIDLPAIFCLYLKYIKKLIYSINTD